MEKSFETLRGQIGLKIQSKLKNINGLTLLKNISRMLSGTRDIEGLNGLPEDISSRDIPYFKTQVRSHHIGRRRALIFRVQNIITQ